jgi:hypothetical protein
MGSHSSALSNPPGGHIVRLQIYCYFVYNWPIIPGMVTERD